MTGATQKALWAAIAVYLLVAFGGGSLFALMVHDSEWRALFASVWWLPSGFVAMQANARIYTFLCWRHRMSAKEPAQESRSLEE